MNKAREIKNVSQQIQQNQQNSCQIQNLNLQNQKEQQQDQQIPKNQTSQNEKKEDNENNENENQQLKKQESKDEFQGEPEQKINISEKIIKLLNINPLNRTEEENHRIANSLKQVHFFKQISKSQTFELCIQNLRLLSIPKNTVLFKQGQSGDNFYIILSGEISISKQLVNNQQTLDNKNSTGQILKKSKFSNIKRQESPQKSDQQQEQSLRKLQSSKSQGQDIYQNQVNYQNQSQNQKQIIDFKDQNNEIQKNDKQSDDEQQNDYIDEDIQDKEQHQKQFLQYNGIDKQISACPLEICNQLSKLTSLKVLHQGDSFGELALLKPQNGTRQATAISQYYTELAYLSREDYQKILKDIHDNSIGSNLRFFQKFPLFQDYNYLYTQKIYLVSTEIHFVKGQILYKEDEVPQFVYFIKSGNFQLTKNEKYTDENIKEQQIYKFIPPQYKHNLGDRVKHQIQLAILGANQIIGHQEIYQNCNRKYSVKCIEAGSGYQMSKLDFKQLLLNQNLKNKILNLIENQTNHYKQFYQIRQEFLENNTQFVKPQNAIKNRQIIDEEQLQFSTLKTIQKSIEKNNQLLQNQIYHNNFKQNLVSQNAINNLRNKIGNKSFQHEYSNANKSGDSKQDILKNQNKQQESDNNSFNDQLEYSLQSKSPKMEYQLNKSSQYQRSPKENQLFKNNSMVYKKDSNFQQSMYNSDQIQEQSQQQQFPYDINSKYGSNNSKQNITNNIESIDTDQQISERSLNQTCGNRKLFKVKSQIAIQPTHKTSLQLPQINQVLTLNQSRKFIQKIKNMELYRIQSQSPKIEYQQMGQTQYLSTQNSPKADHNISEYLKTKQNDFNDLQNLNKINEELKQNQYSQSNLLKNSIKSGLGKITQEELTQINEKRMKIQREIQINHLHQKTIEKQEQNNKTKILTQFFKKIQKQQHNKPKNQKQKYDAITLDMIIKEQNRKRGINVNIKKFQGF